jgi:hypothetical protein
VALLPGGSISRAVLAGSLCDTGVKQNSPSSASANWRCVSAAGYGCLVSAYDNATTHDVSEAVSLDPVSLIGQEPARYGVPHGKSLEHVPFGLPVTGDHAAVGGMRAPEVSRLGNPVW